jgi:molybdopterin-guanine dinucleotide biosynthesis protein B
MHELRGTAEPTLPELVAHLADCDLLLIEGFKHEAIPKLEVHRAVVGEPLLFPHDNHITALASDATVDTMLPQFSLDDITGIAAFIEQQARAL